MVHIRYTACGLGFSGCNTRLMPSVGMFKYPAQGRVLHRRSNLMTESNGILRAIQSPTPADSPNLSLVVPAFKEAANLEHLHEELVQSLAPLGYSWELIIVDDGSPDNTWECIVRLQRRDSRIRGLRLSRNFGHQYALLAGLSEARGAAVITLDADLQHPPSVIPSLVWEWEEGSKIVHTVRRDCPGVSWSKRFTSKMFYRVFSFLSGVHISPGMADFRLLDQQVVREILKLRESGLFLRGLVQWVGYPNTRVEYDCADRFAGNTSYSFGQMLRLAWTGITSFSIVPLRLATGLGLLTSLFAFYELLDAVYVKMFTSEAVPGWTSLYVLVSLLFGILFILIGITGEYIARILEEVRGRPRFVISDRTVRVGAAVAEAEHANYATVA
jgi:glycosyltransferase involved in cell wall biosynthesis